MILNTFITICIWNLLTSNINGKFGYELSIALKNERIAYKNAFYNTDLISNKYLLFPADIKLIYKNKLFELEGNFLLSESDIKTQKGIEDISTNLLVTQPAELSFRREWRLLKPNITLKKSLFNKMLSIGIRGAVELKEISKYIILSTGYINMLRAEAINFYDASREYKITGLIGLNPLNFLNLELYIEGRLSGSGNQSLKIINIDDMHGEYSVFLIRDRSPPINETVIGLNLNVSLGNISFGGGTEFIWPEERLVLNMIEGYKLRYKFDMSIGLNLSELTIRTGILYVDNTISENTDFIHHPSFISKGIFFTSSFLNEHFTLGVKVALEFIKSTEWIGFGNWAYGEGMNLYFLISGSGFY